MAANPGTVLEVAGEGDHRPQLEAAIAERGIGDRVRMHGHVSEEKKLELLQSSWINLTASSAEGWCLTVMEAAGCATPSVAMAVGGLPESIEHGRTGLLADDPEQLSEHIGVLVSDDERREEMGRAAKERAHTFTWDRAAQETLDQLELVRDAVDHQPSLRKRLSESDTGRAAGLAVALMANNFIALIFTIVFARLLGDDGYGSLGALIAAFTILIVPGSALQATVAREVSSHVGGGRGQPGGGRLALARAAGDPHRGHHGWSRCCCASRSPRPIGVEQAWAAAALLPSGMLWLALCVQRGTLQGLGRYRAVGWSIVGEAGARLGMGVALYAAGLGVTGAFLGSTLSIFLVSRRTRAAAGRVARPLADALGAPELPVGAVERLGSGAGLLAHRRAAEHRHRVREARPVR